MSVTPRSEAINLELRAIFARRRQTQGDIAEILDMSQGSIGDRLAGKTSWRLDELLTLCDALDVRLVDIIAAAEPVRRSA